jgi:hypothetical protein
VAERRTLRWNEKAGGWMAWPPRLHDDARRKAAEWAEKWFRLRARMSIKSPLEGERFVTGETIPLDARILSPFAFVSSSEAVTWKSSQDGDLGTGSPAVSLSTGTHVITASKGLLKKSVNVRVFDDLWSLYQAPPAQAEIDRILNDFTFEWVDGTIGDPKQQWSSYPGYPFDQTSPDPSRTAVICKLDVLRHQRFDEPLPFLTPPAQTAYEQVRQYTKTLRVSLGTTLNKAGGGVINLGRSFTRWSAFPEGPTVVSASPYVHSLYLLIHESRHNEPGDLFHASCPTAWNGKPGQLNGTDEKFEPGSGYARSALYLMWVYQYGRFDPAGIRKEAKDAATPLAGRFCKKPTSMNPKVQALLAEFWKA